MKNPPKYWTGRPEKLFTRMHPDVRMALTIAARTERVDQRTIIEQAMIDLIASGDLDAKQRYTNTENYQGCTYRIDSGVLEQLRRTRDATGEPMQTILHEALVRKLSIQQKEEE